MSVTGHNSHRRKELTFSSYWFHYPEPGELCTLNSAVVGGDISVNLQFDVETARWLAGELLKYARKERELAAAPIAAAEAVIECFEDRPTVAEMQAELGQQLGP